MYLTHFSPLTPAFIDLKTCIAYGEALRTSFEEDNFLLPRHALNTYNIASSSRDGHKTGRRALMLRIDGMDESGTPFGTHYASSFSDSRRERVEQGIVLGHLMLHYMPRVESGDYTHETGIMVPAITETPDERICAREALHFAMGFLMPAQTIKSQWAQGGMETVHLHAFLSSSFITVRCKQLGLIKT